MTARHRLKSSSALLFVTACTVQAAASSTFPAAVDQHLKLTGSATVEHAVAPPDGCLLCHMTEAGGFGTNNAFGSELRQAGAVGTEPETVGPALDALETTDPHAIEDILMGMDPNDDHSVPTEALPQPSYGCSVRPASISRKAGGPMTWVSLASLALVVRRARRGRARR